MKPHETSSLKPAACRLIGLVTCLLGLGGCSAAPATPPPQAAVSLARLVVAGPEAGILTVSGGPGAVSGAPVTTLTLTVVREGGVRAYGLRHLGVGLPVASAFATVAADGSFPATRLGSADRPVKLGDELNLTPQDGLVQAGPTVEWDLPAAGP